MVIFDPISQQLMKNLALSGHATYAKPIFFWIYIPKWIIKSLLIMYYIKTLASIIFQTFCRLNDTRIWERVIYRHIDASLAISLAPYSQDCACMYFKKSNCTFWWGNQAKFVNRLVGSLWCFVQSEKGLSTKTFDS